MSSQPVPALRPEDIQKLAEEISTLRDDLAFQNGIYQSLRDDPQDHSTHERMSESRTEIERLKKKLSETRRAHHDATKAALKPKMISSQPPRQNPGSGSGANPIPRPTTPSRKRTYSHANVTPVKFDQPGSRVRRASPSPRVPNSSPSTASSSVIDLTGDDEEIARQIEQQKYEEFARNKRMTQQDAAMARHLQNHGFSPAAGSSFHGTSSPFGPNYRNSPTPMSQANQPQIHAAARHHAPAAAQPAHRYRTPAVQPSPAGMQAAVNPYEGYVRNMPQRPAPQHGFSSHAANGGVQHAVPRFSGDPRVPGAFVNSDDDSEPEITGTNVISRFDLSRAASAADAARAAAMARQYFPDQHIPGYSANVENDRFSAGRPGYIDNGMRNYSQGPGNRFVSGSSLLNQEFPVPGGSLNNAISRTNGYNFDTMTDADGNPLDSRLKSYYTDLVEDPRKTAEELRELISNIRPDMDIPAEERGETPEALKYPLYPHQQLSLKWMSNMEESRNHRGGILADDMGLGKTISALSLMVTRKSTDALKTNLIVGPVALIKQWEVEIRKKLKPEHRLSVFLLHSKKLEYSELKEYDVVLTTFGLLAQEWKRYEKRITERQGDERYHPYDDLELHRKCPLLHPRSKFYRVILDEAQNIKNKDAQASKGAARIEATYRWCLTGTPMMNSVQELFPLIRFLRIKPYNTFSTFQKSFSVLTAKKQKFGHEQAHEQGMKQLRVVLKAIMLRRMKDSEIDGKPILNLPAKTEHIHNCVFSPEEQSFYKGLESKSRITLNKYLRQGTVSKNYAHVLVLLLRLRQACCHPHLDLDFEYASAVDSVPDETMALMESFAKSLDPAVVERLRAAEAFDCPICFDAVEDPTIFVPCGHDTCTECFTALTENSRQVNLRGGDDGEVAMKCPECRAEVFPKKVINYTAFRKVHMPETIVAPPIDNNNAEDEEDSDDSDSDSEVEDSSNDDADEYGDLRDFVVRDDEVDEDDEDDDDGNDTAAHEDDEFPDVIDVLGARTSTKANKPKKAKKSKKAKKGKSKADEVKPHMLKTLRVEASKNQEARRKYMKYLKKNWESSAKVTKICEILGDIEPTGEKTIIFSQWTALLDLLEIPIKHELKIKYRRYDGGMSRAHRDEAIRQFVEDPKVKVLLVSLRAGNAGLNLTVASHVIICDPFWNPFVEMQAVDRAHRIGQLLPVHVHRVVVKSSKENDGEGTEVDETVEDRILALQEKKRQLINGALDEGESRSLGRLSEQDLVRLFGA